jgi:hypothetical protein
MQNMETDNTFWAELDESHCPCEGRGWADIEGNWTECPIHFEGQIHPESKQLLLDDLKQLQEEERKSILRWKMKKTRETIAEIQQSLKEEQAKLVKLELELINRTPTIKAMPAVVVSLLKPDTVMVIEDE